MEALKQELILKISSYQCHTLGDAAEKIFSESGGTFGRNPGNDWVLPDPERFVSSQHGAIHFDAGTFYLTDKSTNGIFLNGQAEPVGKGNVTALSGGEVLRFADYEIQVELRADEPAAKSNAVFPEAPDAALDDITAADSIVEPLLPDDALGESVGGITAPGFDPLAAAPASSGAMQESQEQPPFQTGAADTSPGAYFDNSSSIEAAMPVQGLKVDDNLPDPFEIEEPISGADNSAQIPEDWDMTGFSRSADSANSPVVDPVPAKPAPASPATIPADEHRNSVNSTPPAGAGASAFALSDSVRAEVPPKGSAAVEPAKKPPDNRPASLPGQSDVFDRMLTEFGLAAESFSAAEKEQLADNFAHMLQDMLKGLMDILRARAELKNQFRISQTTIQPVENNPLKFSPSAEEALKTMFSRQGSSYLSATDAIQEGIGDIRNHQIAMISGMQSAFNDMMDRLRPENFDEEQTEANLAKAALQSINRKSRAWQKYMEFYQETVQQSGNAFQILFGEDFSRAYEEQIHRLDALSGKAPGKRKNE